MDPETLKGVRAVLHYLDDFLLLGAPGSPECQDALQITLETCTQLGIPLTLDKVDSSTPRITFLGVELNSSNMALALPADKLVKLRRLLHKFQGAKTVSDHEAFDSLVGHLVHASNIIPLGQAFSTASS